ncbi:DUF21 domain-containing protein At2g14520 isoform X2 [Cryptomeria japonica]|uniref:DUF21 domain-containing protein At2g14520 isoform X2 n=1 Tax=Cryptomeria japonica TaxID=3369 RepID=UPI0025AD5EA9|nr:DUF21 domain-containing protein At2g14520 isoform X2 [Cryptomeria japonica]
MAVQYECCATKFWIYVGICLFLVLFAGLMSGLTLGLMSLSLVDLEVLRKSGKPQDRKYAAKIMPVVKKQHLLLCTLLICNALAMEALPIFLDGLVSPWGAILISVTLILLFGEIIPQSVCSRYGLAVGATVAPVVRVLVWICFPIAWPISKLLDLLLGEGHDALFRRAELKTLVNLHGNEAGKGGELTHDETTIIAGALELTEKTAEDAMTPISETFAIDVNAKLDKVPVNMPLYDILNEFQKGHSHMAVVVRYTGGKKQEQKMSKTIHEHDNGKDVSVIVDKSPSQAVREKSFSNRRSLNKLKSFPATHASDLNREAPKTKRWSRVLSGDILEIADDSLPKLAEDEEIVGIITMEDVIEELLQEEIFDETDIQDS